MFFSSFGFRNPAVSEKFSRALPESALSGRVAVVPFAGFNTERAYANEKEGLIRFGFDPEKIFFADSAASFLIAPDVIYVPGGDPFKLLSEMKKRSLIPGIRKLVLESGALYIGVSAGAYVASGSIEYVKQLEDNNVICSDFSALGLVPEAIVCHAEHYSYPQLEACRSAAGTRIIAIRDDQLVGADGSAREYID